MEIVKMKLSELNPAAYNPRKELKPGDPAYEKLKASILSFGNVEPIVWNRSTGNVIGGHQRLRVLMDLGVSESEISVVELTEVDEKRLNIALNKITGEWDDEKLTALLADITAGGADVYSAGFDDQELSSMFAELSKASAHDDDFNLTAALEKASFVRRGDIWTVGRHRLMCGDATSAEDVAVLMDGKKANLILTDPPYGVSFQSSDGLTIQNDSIKGDDFYRFLLQSLTNMVAHLEPGGAVYVFHADTEGLHFRRAFIDAGLHLAGVCIWVKNSLVLGRSDYQWQHEPVLYGFLQNGKHHWYADRKQTTIWNYDKPKRNENHPTSKPLDLLGYPICNSSQENAIVLDTLGGSGSTLMACEQLGRTCCTMELDEKYASVILRRYAESAGKTSGISVLRDGKRIPYTALVKEVESRGHTDTGKPV
ncbi:site-specific DNA-methyltransferase [uncultured Oscillibacter sp.]|uniref:site-specific DNA-methyltransferase n=1 Tax=uncultured Oscillibacter sp. TaxID=876091 RepID=UPI00262AAE92|nr:site-specific DNA-methyltransferase [uncultured Oscillibacter sp.]